MKSKANKHIKEQRIKQIIAMLVIGKYRWEIVQDLSKEWKCSEKNVDLYIADAKALMSSHFSQETFEDLLSKYQYLYSECISKGDRRTAGRILDSIAKVGGYVQDKIEISGSINENINVIKIIEVIKDDTKPKE